MTVDLDARHPARVPRTRRVQAGPVRGVRVTGRHGRSGGQVGQTGGHLLDRLRHGDPAAPGAVRPRSRRGHPVGAETVGTTREMVSMPPSSP